MTKNRKRLIGLFVTAAFGSATFMLFNHSKGVEMALWVEITAGAVMGIIAWGITKMLHPLG